MTRLRFSVALLALLSLTSCTLAVDPPPLATAQGAVDKVDKDSLTLRPRGPDGKFMKSVTLKLTGTSKVSTLAPQTRAGKLVLTQKDTDAKDLQPGQAIAVIYTTVKDTSTLLTAVVQPADGK
jgi:hypothetical protein